jgi:hypothetical protein
MFKDRAVLLPLSGPSARPGDAGTYRRNARCASPKSFIGHGPVEAVDQSAGAKGVREAAEADPMSVRCKAVNTLGGEPAARAFYTSPGSRRCVAPFPARNFLHQPAARTFSSSCYGVRCSRISTLYLSIWPASLDQLMEILSRSRACSLLGADFTSRTNSAA